MRGYLVKIVYINIEHYGNIRLCRISNSLGILPEKQIKSQEVSSGGLAIKHPALGAKGHRFDPKKVIRILILLGGLGTVRHYTYFSKKSRHSGFSPLNKRPEFEFTVRDTHAHTRTRICVCFVCLSLRWQNIVTKES